jgi:hypothetical protein
VCYTRQQFPCDSKFLNSTHTDPFNMKAGANFVHKKCANFCLSQVQSHGRWWRRFRDTFLSWLRWKWQDQSWPSLQGGGFLLCIQLMGVSFKLCQSVAPLCKGSDDQLR